MNLQEHLSWLLYLLKPPFTEAWKQHCWHRAKELANDPELSDLPRLLAEAMLRQSSSNVESATASSATTPGSPSA